MHNIEGSFNSRFTHLFDGRQDAGIIKTLCGREIDYKSVEWTNILPICQNCNRIEIAHDKR